MATESDTGTNKNYYLCLSSRWYRTISGFNFNSIAEIILIDAKGYVGNTRLDRSDGGVQIVSK